MTVWAEEWHGHKAGWTVTISLVAGHNPAEIRRIRRRCTYTEIAEAYKSMMACDPYFPFDED